MKNKEEIQEIIPSRNKKKRKSKKEKAIEESKRAIYLEGYAIKDILRRIMDEYDKETDKIINPKYGNAFNKSNFFDGINTKDKISPICQDTYYKYKQMAYEEIPSQSIKSIDLKSFYKICKFTNVSADYYLGFRETTRREPSAPTVREDFGLSDMAMNTLSAIHKNKVELNGELSSSVINSILENQVFWNKINEFLPVYVQCLNYSRFNDFDIEVARYSLVKAFEELIDEIVKPMINEDLEKLDFNHDNLQSKLDLTGIYPKTN